MDGPSDLERRLADVRRRALPTLLARVDAIDRATAAGAPSDDLEAGRAEAHKLRGVLGTIGLMRGTELAAAIEIELDEVVGGHGKPGWRERVATLAAAVRAEIERD